MKASIVTTLAAVTVALGALGPSAVRAQAHTDHLMVVPGELTWADAPAVAPGAKIAVVEGPLNKAVPFTFRLRLPENTKIAAHTHPAYERVTVLSGTFYFAAGDTYDPAVPAGQLAIDTWQPMSAARGRRRQRTGRAPWGCCWSGGRSEKQ
jgi:hypothetical protein